MRIEHGCSSHVAEIVARQGRKWQQVQGADKEWHRQRPPRVTVWTPEAAARWQNHPVRIENTCQPISQNSSQNIGQYIIQKVQEK